MSNSPADLSTFQRSCQHWSEDGRKGMDAFYRLASLDYQLLAEQLDWGQVFQQLQGDTSATIQLLDVACGSGQFPEALLKYGRLEQQPNLRVAYSLLDPSEFSIRTASEKLRGPLEPAEKLCCTVQELQSPDGKFQVVWATHALYCVPPAELDVALDRMIASLDKSGLGFIAHASHNSHYLQFHNKYIQSLSTRLDPYCTGEQVVDRLRAKLGADVYAWSIDYEGTLPLDDVETAELYLQRCLFDDSISLDNMLSHPELGKYLRGCIDRPANRWHFKQQVWLIFFGRLGRDIAARRQP